VLVARLGDEVFALEDACPHSGRSLSEGCLRDGAVVCPGHQWEVDLRTGAVRTAVGAGLSNPVYEVRREGDELVVYAGT